MTHIKVKKLRPDYYLNHIYMDIYRVACRLNLTRSASDGTPLFTYDLKNIQGILTLFMLYTDLRVIVVKHNGIKKKKETPHLHFVFESKDPEIESRIRGFFKKNFTLGTGNGHHSIKPAYDLEKSLFSYLFHENGGSDCVVYNQGFTDHEVDDFIALNIEVQSTWETPQELCKAIAIKYKSSVNPPKLSHRYIASSIWYEYSKKDTFFPNKAQLDRYIYYIYSLIKSQENTFEFFYSQNFKS